MKTKSISRLSKNRDMKLMVKDICEKHGIEIISNDGNSHKDDLRYSEKDKQKLISILDSYLK